jgi:GH25 family lysozyme M1 (1,4-beta-N-acetylmuramidase)
VTIFGWDASDFDWDRGPMDLAAARAQGVDFFTHKATEGVSTKHRRYGEALARARAAGVPFLGAYHVVRSGPSIAAQVEYLLAYANSATPWWRDHPGWFWQCDLEHWSYDQVPASRGVDFCVALAQRTGRAVLLYAPRWAYGDGIGGQAPLWASNYVTGTGNFRSLYPGDSSSKWGPYSGRAPQVLQYTSHATIGRQNTCDANAFRGSLADFARLIGATDRTNLEGATMADVYGLGGDPGDQRNTNSRVVDLWVGELEMPSPGYHGYGTPTPRTGRLMRIEAGVAQAVAAAAADAQRDNAALAAITSLAALIQQGGGNVDVAAVIAAVRAVGDDTHTAMVAVQQQLANALDQLAAANAELAAVRAAAEVGLSPAERDALHEAQ